MPDWQLIASRLYASLKAMPCRCERKWVKPATFGEPDFEIIKRCSRCVATELYEQAQSA